ESGAGFRVACTRQNVGRLLRPDIAPGSGAPPGGTNAPAATCCADVMVVWGSLSVARLSQVAAKTCPEPIVKMASAISRNPGFILRFNSGIGFPLPIRRQMLTQSSCFSKASRLVDGGAGQRREGCVDAIQVEDAHHR